VAKAPMVWGHTHWRSQRGEAPPAPGKILGPPWKHYDQYKLASALYFHFL
jgi:hypothetical protein